MGRSYLFECSRCGYRARVSGRADRGVEFFVQSIVCADCKELYDAVVKLRLTRTLDLKTPGKWGALMQPPQRGSGAAGARQTPKFEAVVARLPKGGARLSTWVQYKLACPVSPFHRVQPWNDPSHCPRCGVYLEKSAVPYRVWD